MTITVTDEYLGVQEIGTHIGIPMYFVEVQTTTDGNAHHENEKDIIDRALEYKVKWLAVRSSKEDEDPYSQDLDRLIALAFANNIKTFIETSGQRVQQCYTDWICLRPIKDKAVEPFFKQIANEILFEIKSLDDVDYIIRNFYNPNQPLTLTISEDKFEEVVPKVAGLRNIRVFIDPQTIVPKLSI